MEKFFKLREHNTNVKQEIIAGITTFLSMAYILAVNPTMLSQAGMDAGAVFTATAISAAAATLFMGLFANYPIALASGMGLNAYFTYAVCIPLAEQGIAEPWKIALAAVFAEGIIFMILSVFKFRERLINDIPRNLKYGITVGIGLFITLIGFENAGIVIADSSTLVNIGAMTSPQFVLACIGVLAIAALQHYKVICPILWGILLTWGLSMVAEKTGWYAVNAQEAVYSVFPSFSDSFMPTAPEVFAFDFTFIAENTLQFMAIVFSFLFVDIFDTVGGLIGIADSGGFLDEKGRVPKAEKALLADAVGTVTGACLGTSTVTTYMESCAGVEQGGRTGLTSVSAAVMFLIAMFLSPIFLAIPAFATAPALIIVGLSMMNSVKKMDFEGDIADSLGGFSAITIMAFTYSIANGIMFGILSWAVLKILCGKIREIPSIMWISSFLFLLRIVTV